MNAGAENRKKTILAGSLGAVALCCVVYGYTQLFGGSSAPAPPPSITTNNPSPAPALAIAAPVSTGNATPGANGQPAIMPTGNAPGVGLKKLASTSASLDPTLDESAMLRTERLLYTGNGRNIFSATYTPPVVIAKLVAPPRPKPCPPNCPPPPPPPPPPPTCPPSCPPIPLKFFGTAQRPGGDRQAFLLSGDDVFLAAAGDIVSRRYKVLSVSANSVQIQDLTNTYTQTLPLQAN